MADFNTALIGVKEIEGGFQDSDKDKGNYYCADTLGWVKGKYPNYYCPNGGEIVLVGTNRGIAAPVYAKYLGRQITRLDVELLSQSTAELIFKNQYWDAIKGNQINDQFVANILFDGRVNHGPKGTKLMQEVLGVSTDGVVGPITLAAINNANPAVLYNDYKWRRFDFYHQLVANDPSQSIFINGWENRILAFNDYGVPTPVPPIVNPSAPQGSAPELEKKNLSLIGFLIFGLGLLTFSGS